MRSDMVRVSSMRKTKDETRKRGGQNQRWLHGKRLDNLFMSTQNYIISGGMGVADNAEGQGRDPKLQDDKNSVSLRS
jgi:hypothetical protein